MNILKHQCPYCEKEFENGLAKGGHVAHCKMKPGKSPSSESIPEKRKYTLKSSIPEVSIPKESVDISALCVSEKMDDYVHDPNILIPWKTGKGLDVFISKRGGVMPATATMVVGPPGSGKTTIANDVLISISKNHPKAKVLSVNAEMSKIDYLEEVEDNPALGLLPMIFLVDLIQENPTVLVQDFLLTIFNSDTNVMMIDSFAELAKLLKRDGLTATQAEHWLLTQIQKTMKTKSTAFFIIQQVTGSYKGGGQVQYKGSSELEHLFTAMMYIQFDKSGQRYMSYSKNRRNGGIVNSRLYFTKPANEIIWDLQRYENSKRIASKAEEELENLKSNEDRLKKFSSFGAALRKERSGQENFESSLLQALEDMGEVDPIAEMA